MVQVISLYRLSQYSSNLSATSSSRQDFETKLKKKQTIFERFYKLYTNFKFFEDNNNGFPKKDVPFATVDSFEGLHSLMDTKENGIFIDGNGWIHIIMFQGDRRKGGTWTDQQVS